MKRFHYFAFISYSRKDEYWAKWLHKKLESYKLPNIIRKEYKGQLPDKIHPVFLDKTDIGLGSLKTNLKKELEDSRYLIVICSPHSATSEWVNTEVEHFNSLGREDRIVPFIVQGNPKPKLGKENQCYPPALDKSTLGASISELPKEQAFIKIVAYLLGLKFDELWDREKKRQKNQKIFTTVISIMIILLFLLLGFNAYKSNKNRELAEQYTIISKAKNIHSHASKLKEIDPSKSLYLYATAYALHPDSTIFYDVEKLYNQYNKSILQDSSRKKIDHLNLFYRTIAIGHYINIDSLEDATDTDLDIDYMEEDLVKFSLSNRLIMELQRNNIYIKGLNMKIKNVIACDSFNIQNWWYNETQNKLFLLGKSKKRKKEYLYVYDIGKCKLRLLLSVEKINGYLEEGIYKKEYENNEIKGVMNSLSIFSPNKMKYALIYYSAHNLFTYTFKNIRKFIVIDLNNDSVIGILSLPVKESFMYCNISSISTDSSIVVIKFHGTSYEGSNENYLVAFRPEYNQQSNLYTSANGFGDDHPIVSYWIKHNSYQFLLIGKNNGQINVEELLYHKSFILSTKDMYGGITAITDNKNYVFAGTKNGYIVCWNKSFFNKGSFIISNVTNIKATQNSITDLQCNDDLLIFKDDKNIIKACKLKEYTKLSMNPKILIKQIKAMNIDGLFHKDSLEYGL